METVIASKKNAIFQPKINFEQRMLLLRMHAEGYNAPTIKKEILEKYDLSISDEIIYQSCRIPKWQPYLKEFKEAYLARVREVPIANKRYRLDDMEKVRSQLVKMLDKNPLKTKADRAEYLAVTSRLNVVLAEAREEMEKKPNLISNTNIQMGAFSDSELQDRRDKLIDRYKRLVGDSTAGADSNTRGVESEDEG